MTGTVVMPATERERQGKESKGLWMSNGNTDNFEAGGFFACWVKGKLIANILPLCIKMCIIFFWLFYLFCKQNKCCTNWSKKRISMHAESLTIVNLHNYDKKGAHKPSTVLINVSKINWWSLDFHSRQGPATKPT